MRRLAELVLFSVCTALFVWALIRWFPPESATEVDSAGDQLVIAMDGNGWIEMYAGFAYDDDGDMDLFVVPLEPTLK